MGFPTSRPAAQHAGGRPGLRRARNDESRCCNRDLGGAASSRAVPSCGAVAAATAARRAGGVCTYQCGPGPAAAAWLWEDALLPETRCRRGQGSPASHCACSTPRRCTATSTVLRGGLLGSPAPMLLLCLALACSVPSITEGACFDDPLLSLTPQPHLQSGPWAPWCSSMAAPACPPPSSPTTPPSAPSALGCPRSWH